MAPQEGLLPKTITDRNGHVTTRWVKPEGIVMGAAKLPPLKLKSDESALLHSLAKVEQEQKDISNHGGDTESLYAKHRLRSIKIVRREKDLGRMKVYVDLFPIKGLDPRDIEYCIKSLSDHYPDGDAPTLTEEHVSAVKKYRAVFQSSEALKSDMDKRREMLSSLMKLTFEDPTVVDRVLPITERGVTDMNEIKRLLKEIEQVPNSVQTGYL